MVLAIYLEPMFLHEVMILASQMFSATILILKHLIYMSFRTGNKQLLSKSIIMPLLPSVSQETVSVKAMLSSLIIGLLFRSSIIRRLPIWLSV